MFENATIKHLLIQDMAEPSQRSDYLVVVFFEAPLTFRREHVQGVLSLVISRFLLIHMVAPRARRVG